MAHTMPQMQRTMDDAFVNTWYEIKPDVVDNVLEATILTLALKEHGCFQSRAGGTYGWEDTTGYGDKDVKTQRFQKGSTLDQQPVPLDTYARLDWRFFCVDINRSFVDDQTNMGKYQIKSYLARRLEAARNALVRDIETYLFQWGNYYAAPKQPNGIWDCVAPQTALSTASDGSDSDTQASGTSNGHISRANAWWRNWVMYDGAGDTSYTDFTAQTNPPYSLNFIPDMRHFWNCITANMEPPNFIITTQDIYEAYEDEGVDRMQVVRTAFNRKALDLGFESQTYKGATFTYSNKMPANHMLMLNLNYLTMNYHPGAWFDMTNWKETANQLERVAYIVCMTPGLATAQPRRHGVAVWAS